MRSLTESLESGPTCLLQVESRGFGVGRSLSAELAEQLALPRADPDPAQLATMLTVW
jgi:hypothetical protein